MKKVIYLASLFIAWLVSIIALALILVICGVIPTSLGWGYALGGACGLPQLWLISAGITMLIRPILHKAIFNENRVFKKVISTILIVIGIVWLAMNLGARMYHQVVEKAVLERMQENEEEIIDYVPGMFDNEETK